MQGVVISVLVVTFGFSRAIGAESKSSIFDYIKVQLCESFKPMKECSCLDSTAKMLVSDSMQIVLKGCLYDFRGYCTNKNNVCLNVGPTKWESDNYWDLVIGKQVCRIFQWPPQNLNDCSMMLK